MSDFRDAVAVIVARHASEASEEILQLCARQTALALMPGDGPKGEPQPVWDAAGRFLGYGPLPVPRKPASDDPDATGAAT